MGFMDQREWIAKLDEAGQLARVKAPVDSGGELAAICRRVLNRQGPALLFEQIVGHDPRHVAQVEGVIEPGRLVGRGLGHGTPGSPSR